MHVWLPWRRESSVVISMLKHDTGDVLHVPLPPCSLSYHEHSDSAAGKNTESAAAGANYRQRFPVCSLKPAENTSENTH